MSEVTPPAGAGAPVVTPPAVVTAPAAVVTPPAVPPPVVLAPPQVIDQNPPWLDERLKRAESAAQAALLKSLGVDDPEAAKQAIAAAKAAADAKKTAEERAAELDAKLRGSLTESEKQSAIIKEHASRMLMALPAGRQKAITDFAGDNPGEQLRAIHAFAPTWAKEDTAADAKAAEAAALAAAEAAKSAPPATTAPAPNAPAGTTPGSPPDPQALYAAARARNPFAAAAYGAANPAAYETKR